ncbi:hypothetical protein ACXYL9_03140 [Qipengyuania sp. CAU 1752]
MASPDLTKYWKKKLVSRASCEQLLVEAEVELAREWLAHREAVLLALAQTLTSAVRRQVKDLSWPRDPSPSEYRKVAAFSRKFQALVESLQDTNDPPPMLELDDRGRNAWVYWETRQQLNYEARGAQSRTEKSLLLELVALRQEIAGSEKPGFSRGENTPLARFLPPAFGLARDAFLSLVKDPGDRQAHSLVPPNEEALVKHRDDVELKVCRSIVVQRLERCREKAGAHLGEGK